MQTLGDIAHELEQLRRLLLRLPPKDHPSGYTYPFEGFIIDEEFVEFTGSIQGAVNHTLEVAFGSRANADNAPLEFESHGPGLVAVVDILSNAITGTHGENPILLKWVSDLQVAANHAFNQSPTTRCERKPTEKRLLIDVETEMKADAKKQKTEAKAKAEEAKARTEGNYNFDPKNLRPITVPKRKAGRKTNPLLDQLTVYCETAPTLGESQPRSLDRILNHAMECKFLGRDLVDAASSACASKSFGSQLEALTLSSGKPTKSSHPSGLQPSVHPMFHEEGQRQRSMRHNHFALTAVCVHSLPPTLVDSRFWRRMIWHLDPKIDIKSGSHLAHALIPAEAARAHEKSIEYFKDKTNLTLSFDGATTRLIKSVYTVHVTCPDTRQAHLLAGDKALGKLHTGVHKGGVILKVLTEIGPERFSALNSDGAANVLLARNDMASKFRWILSLTDVCHQMSNTGKDLSSLPQFAEANHQMRIIIRFFRKSSYAAHHLEMWRVIVSVSQGLKSIGKTRFLIIYYVIEALLPCIPGIVELIRTGVIALKKDDKLAWLKEKQAVRAFEDTLRQEKAILEPFARSVKCLESSVSTLSDVCVFWLASLATLQDVFDDSYKRNELMLTEDTISDVYGIVNARFSQMIEGPDRQMYFTAMFLDFRYLGSSIFTRRNINILANTIRLPVPSGSNQSFPKPVSHDTPDSDLRAGLPAYVRAGSYLASILVDEINSGRAPKVFDHYDNVQAIITEFRFQLMNYTRQSAPFDRYFNATTPLEYWKKLYRHSDAQVLAYLAIKLFSIVPNSMAEERTVSTLTKMNAPERGRQKVSTLIQMTQVKQHEQRIAGHKDTAPPPTAPTVRFRDLSDYVKGLGYPTPVTHNQPQAEQSNNPEKVGSIPKSDAVDTWEAEAGFDEEIERPCEGSRLGFEIADAEHVNLAEPLLLDLLSDEPVPEAIPRAPANVVLPKSSERAEGKQPLLAESFTF